MSQTAAVAKERGRRQEAILPNGIEYYEEKIARLEREVRRLRPYQKMAVIDHLTSIYNRRYFDTRLEEEIARMSRKGFPFCVCILDLDHFKTINDNYGHGMGDLVLREFAHLLKKNLRRLDVVCRIGGEEFAVIMPETDITAGLLILERILEKVTSQPFVIQKQSIRISFSGGIVSNTQSFMDHHQILEVADQALYEAKRSGRNQIMARCC